MNINSGEPFLTEDFSQDGGGIDFLGLRFVNLRILGNRLLPEINNAVRDCGTFFLGVWIPWKFRLLCEKNGMKFYTEKNYSKFREKIEVAMSIAMRDEGLSANNFGRVRNRVGNNQKKELGDFFSFKNAGRKKNNTIFSAPLYGPSFKYLGLIKSYGSEATDGSTLDIPVVSEKEDTQKIAETVDINLRNSKFYDSLSSLDETRLSPQEVDSLALTGLCPSFYRSSSNKSAKTAFAKKLMPIDPTSHGYPRTLTAYLLYKTLLQKPQIDLGQVRRAWYTQHFDDGKFLNINNEVILKHLRFWEVFMAKQYQRYFTELFLWCFEKGIKSGCSSSSKIVFFWADEFPNEIEYLTIELGKFLDRFATESLGEDLSERRLDWNTKVHGGHESFEFRENPKQGNALKQGLEMLASWYWRMLSRREELEELSEYTMGGADRMSIAWFLKWIETRRSTPVLHFFIELFDELIFSQHIRIALSRFDGSTQRLRFAVGDNGLEPVGTNKNFANMDLPWMADRLGSFTDLLSDLEVLEKKGETISLGKNAEEFIGTLF